LSLPQSLNQPGEQPQLLERATELVEAAGSPPLYGNGQRCAVAPALENGAPYVTRGPRGSVISGTDGDSAAQVERIGYAGENPNLSAYVARGEARPAYKRAFDDQLAVFTGKRPTGLLSSAWSSRRSSRCPEIYRPRP